MLNKDIKLTEENQKEAFKFGEMVDELAEIWNLHTDKKNNSIEKIKELKEKMMVLNNKFVESTDPKEIEKLRLDRREISSLIEEEELLSNSNPTIYLKKSRESELFKEQERKATIEYNRFCSLIADEKKRIQLQYEENIDKLDNMEKNHRFKEADARTWRWNSLLKKY